MIKKKEILDFYKNRKVLVTGSTGFKGAWLCLMLYMAGAEVYGYSLRPDDTQLLFGKIGLEDKIHQFYADIRDFDKLSAAFNECKPEFVFHLAAQPLVVESYVHPRYTFDTNIMGTVNILECIRRSELEVSFLNVTTDKVYDNEEKDKPYKENDRLDGYDPYSNSKSCSELVTHSYKRSFFYDGGCFLSTARAGNVIGGGDYAKNRIIPDCVKAALGDKNIVIRNPYSVRPYQHVIEPLYTYLMIAANQYKNADISGNYNIGPDADDCQTTLKLVEIFCQAWGEGMKYTVSESTGPHEAGFLKLDCSHLKNVFGWKPVYSIKEAVYKTVEWNKRILGGESASEVCMSQIDDFYKIL